MTPSMTTNSATDGRLRIVPSTLREANAFVASFHRHNKPVRGCRFTLAAQLGSELIGVAIVGRPVARMLEDGLTAELLRLCTDGVLRRLPNGHTLPVSSRLYATAYRAWFAMGGRRLITYTLASECGSSLRAANLRPVAEVAAAEWSRAGRLRSTQAVYGEPKIRWEIAA